MSTLSRIGTAPSIAVEWAGLGPLVVCLHGIGGNRKTWRHQMGPLAEEFTVAAWDARGYRDSDDYDGPLRFADFSADLKQVMAAFGTSRAHVVGHSMGGRIALDFYARYPECVASLVLADTSAGSAEQASEAKVEEFLALRRQPLLEGKSLTEIAPAIARSLVGPNCSSAALAEVTESLSLLHRESYLKTLEAVTRFTDFPRFESVEVPVLVVVGEYDRIATPAYAFEMASRLRGRFEVLSNAGHTSNMECPAAFNTVLLDFLRLHRDRASIGRVPPQGWWS